MAVTLEPRLAVVTGASSGIGAATARRLGVDGWRVVLVARRADRLAQVAQDVETAGGVAHVEALDAADADAVAAMAARVRERWGVPDAIVNAAGAGRWLWPEDTPPELMERMLDAPYRAAYLVTHAFLDGMLALRSGTIVHVGSPASLAPWPSATAYTVARWALRGLHEALRQDLAGTGVTTSHVVLGEVTSEYFVTNADSRQWLPRVGRFIRAMDPYEAAGVVVATVLRPRPQVLHPPMLRAFAAANRLAPGLVRAAARRTGRQRPGLEPAS